MYVKATELRLFFQERNLSSRNKESHTVFKIPMVHSLCHTETGGPGHA